MLDLLLDDFAHVSTGLDGHLRNAREAVAVHHVADDEQVRLIAHGQVGVDRNLAGAVGLDTELIGNLLAQRGSGNTGGPDLGRGADGGLLLGLHVLVGHGVRVHVGHHRVEDDGHARLLQLALRLLAQALAKRRQDLRRAVQQVDLGLLGAKGVATGSECAVRHLGHLAGQLHTGRACADDDEGQFTLALFRGLSQLSTLESGNKAGADLKRVVQRLQARGELRKVVVAEVGLAGTGCDDEGVVGERGLLAALHGGDGLRLHIDGLHRAANHADVLLVAEHLAHIAGDLAGGHQAGCHLVEQRREEVVVGVVDQRDVDVSVCELLRRVHAAKTCAHDDNVVSATFGAVHLRGHE